MTQEEVARHLLTNRVALSMRLLAMVRTAQAAEDIFQDVVVKALPRADEFSDPAHLLAWARVTSKNQAIDQLRKHRQSSNVVGLDDIVIEKLIDEADRLPDVERRMAALTDCFKQLPEKSRRVVHLRYAQGLAGTVVAKMLGDNVGAIYQRLARIHWALRPCVEERLAATGEVT
jgi:RNA polymerase sigma-70 factor (ECF subfamily)